MKTREKGRFLRSRGWQPNAFAGRVTWLDPQNLMAGALSTKDAFEKETARQPIGTWIAPLNNDTLNKMLTGELPVGKRKK